MTATLPTLGLARDDLARADRCLEKLRIGCDERDVLATELHAGTWLCAALVRLARESDPIAVFVLNRLECLKRELKDRAHKELGQQLRASVAQIEHHRPAVADGHAGAGLGTEVDTHG